MHASIVHLLYDRPSSYGTGKVRQRRMFMMSIALFMNQSLSSVLILFIVNLFLLLFAPPPLPPPLPWMFTCARSCTARWRSRWLLSRARASRSRVQLGRLTARSWRDRVSTSRASAAVTVRVCVPWYTEKGRKKNMIIYFVNSLPG